MYVHIPDALLAHRNIPYGTSLKILSLTPQPPPLPTTLFHVQTRSHNVTEICWPNHSPRKWRDDDVAVRPGSFTIDLRMVTDGPKRRHPFTFKCGLVNTLFHIVPLFHSKMLVLRMSNSSFCILFKIHSSNMSIQHYCAAPYSSQFYTSFSHPYHIWCFDLVYIHPTTSDAFLRTCLNCLFSHLDLLPHFRAWSSRLEFFLHYTFS